MFRQCKLPVRRFIGNTNPRSLGLARWPRKSDHSPHEWFAASLYSSAWRMLWSSGEWVLPNSFVR